MLTDARIRLEGQLEEIERAAAVLELALPPAKKGSWGPVKIAYDTVGVPSVWRAVQATREMAKAEPELETVLRRHDAARIAIADAVHAAARKRALPSATVRQELDRLAADEVLYEARLRSPSSSLVFPFVGVFAVMLIAAPVPIRIVLAVVAAAVTFFFGLVPFLLSTHVLLTRETLIIGMRSVRTADIRRVVLRSGFAQSSTPYLITVELTGGSLEDRLPEAPLELDAALRRLHIETQRLGNWWY
jgi:hypothetical protein